MNAPLVSVIIPTYNCARYIDQTLQCLRDQTHAAVEIIVVDDGSTDGTPDLVRRFGQGVRLVEQRNAGVCAARNVGYRAAQGAFLCFMDHDDYWFPQKLAMQLRAFDEHPASGLVFSKFYLWFPGADGSFPDPATLDDGQGYGIEQAYTGWIYHLLMLDCWVLTSSAMIRREALETAGLFDENLPYSEDWDLWLRLARHVPFTKIAKGLTLYRQHPSQGSKFYRDVDYRTRLLESYHARYGLVSPDGSSIPEALFARKLAQFHFAYGVNQAQAGRHDLAKTALKRSMALKNRNPRLYWWLLRSTILGALGARSVAQA